MKHFTKYSFIILLFAVFAACTNSVIAPQSSSQVITPPNTNNVNTTTSIDSIGGVGSMWVMSPCQVGQTCLTSTNSVTNTTVTVCFSSTPTAGVYQLVSSNSLLSPGKAILTVMNPPGQPAGSIWYSASGTTTVFNIGPNVAASFINIPCLDSPGTLDSVIVSGRVDCL